MKFGLMGQIQMPRPWDELTERKAFWHGIDQAVAAEHAGFEYFWLTEQHFFIEIGHCSSPEMFLAALSQKTTRLRLGFGVILMPCHNPFYIAERVATLDVLSNGRAEFGAGRGTSPYMVEALGFKTEDGRDVGREALEAVLLMFDHEKFPGYRGKHFDLPSRYVVPRPIQRPHPRIWVAASNLDTYAHAGRQGFGVIGVTRNTPDETRPFIQAYKEAICSGDTSARVARKINNENGVFCIGAVHTDDRLGRDIGCAAARWYYGDNDAEINPVRFATGGGVDAIRKKIQSYSDEDLIRAGMAIGGNPETVYKTLRLWADIGMDQMLFMVQAGETTHAQAMRSIQLIGEKVIPRFG
jgi:alkanesulfonate monooxygenase SsuD/methylene tetrahydromethanopterin reductase-like flavin-dependent oxidoreductase (luciferase family)